MARKWRWPLTCSHQSARCKPSIIKQKTNSFLLLNIMDNPSTNAKKTWPCESRTQYLREKFWVIFFFVIFIIYFQFCCSKTGLQNIYIFFIHLNISFVSCHSLINNSSYLNILYTYRWDKQSTDQFNKFIIFFVCFLFLLH